jgi:DNA-binding NtrC family response regulator
MDKVNILVVDDEPSIRELFTKFFNSLHYNCVAVENGGRALEKIKADKFHVLFTDLEMPGMHGMEVLAQAKKISPDTCVVIITGFGTIDSTVEAMKLGAEDYLIKPLELAQVDHIIKRVLNSRETVMEQTNGPDRNGFGGLVGKSEAMKKVYRMIVKAAQCDSIILVQGENGTGKELVARAIHNQSGRSRQPFVPIDCSVLSEKVIESELFGHVKGAFTDAYHDREGLLKIAGSGTIFLDEIGDITPAVQSKLLRVIQEREIRPVGSSIIEKFEARIIIATNKNLEDMVRKSAFREDLFYRIQVMPIIVPPLRERAEDIPLLVEYFIDTFNTKHKKVRGITRPALEALRCYNWPGNVRELENSIERAINLAEGSIIDTKDFPDTVTAPHDGPQRTARPEVKPIRQMEKEMISLALKKTNDDKKEAAQLLGIGLSTLYSKIKEYEL